MQDTYEHLCFLGIWAYGTSPIQSGFQKQLSIETALLGVSHYELMSFDPDNCSLLVLLGLGSAFDIVNHLILMKNLSDWVGISVSVSLLETLICLHCPVVSQNFGAFVILLEFAWNKS